MLAALLAMPVSVGLLIWFLRMKKDDPFPKYTFVKLLIAGAIAGILSAIVTFAVQSSICSCRCVLSRSSF